MIEEREPFIPFSTVVALSSISRFPITDSAKFAEASVQSIVNEFNATPEPRPVRQSVLPEPPKALPRLTVWYAPTPIPHPASFRFERTR